jgi:hypothetical protein
MCNTKPSPRTSTFLPSNNERRAARCSTLLASLLVMTGFVAQAADEALVQRPRGVKIFQFDDRLRVNINGDLFTQYHFTTNTPRPFFYPVIGPTGSGMTRNFPMKKVEGEETDHVHHRGLWYGHGAVNGIDFWTDGKGRIVHRGFDMISSGENFGIIKSSNDWVAADGKIICTDTRDVRIRIQPDNQRIVDFKITLHASHGPLTLGDTKEGMMAIRVAESMRLTKQTPRGQKPIPGLGHIINSEGNHDAEAWGKRAAWCDYHGPVNGRTVGVAILDHPKNPSFPTWWMARDYGLFTANAFGKHEFEKLEDKTAGEIRVPDGQSLTFLYRFIFHEGDEVEGKIAEQAREFTGAPRGTLPAVQLPTP